MGAMETVKRALEVSRGDKTRCAGPRTYVAAGQADKAKTLADGLSAQLQIAPQAYGKLIEGETALKNGDGRGAVKLFTEANNLLATWLGRFDLGRGYLETDAFTASGLTSQALCASAFSVHRL